MSVDKDYLTQLIEKQLLQSLTISDLDGTKSAEDVLAQKLKSLIALSHDLPQETTTDVEDGADEADLSEFYKNSIIDDDDLFARFLEKDEERKSQARIDTEQTKSPVQNPDDIIKSNEEFIAKFLAEHSNKLPLDDNNNEEEEYEEEVLDEDEFEEEEIILDDDDVVVGKDDDTEIVDDDDSEVIIEDDDDDDNGKDHSSSHESKSYGDYARVALGISASNNDSAVEEESYDESGDDKAAADYYGYGDDSPQQTSKSHGSARPKHVRQRSQQNNGPDFQASLSDVEEHTESSASSPQHVKPTVPHYRMTRRLSTGDYARMMLGMPLQDQGNQSSRTQISVDDNTDDDEVIELEEDEHSSKSLPHSHVNYNHLSRDVIETQVRTVFSTESVIDLGLLTADDMFALDYAQKEHFIRILGHMGTWKTAGSEKPTFVQGDSINWRQIAYTLQSVNGELYHASDEDEDTTVAGRNSTGIRDNDDDDESSDDDGSQPSDSERAVLSGNDDKWQNESLGSGYSFEVEKYGCDSSITDFEDLSNDEGPPTASPSKILRRRRKVSNA